LRCDPKGCIPATFGFSHLLLSSPLGGLSLRSTSAIDRLLSATSSTVSLLNLLPYIFRVVSIFIIAFIVIIHLTFHQIGQTSSLG